MYINYYINNYIEYKEREIIHLGLNNVLVSYWVLYTTPLEITPVQNNNRIYFAAMVTTAATTRP